MGKIIKNNTSNVNGLAIAVVLLVIFINILVLNYFTSLYKDDFKYGFLSRFDLSNGFIENVKEIIIYQYRRFFYSNGRSIVHFIIQIFLLILGKQIFKIVNAAMFVLFVLLLSKFMGKIKTINILFSFALVVLLFPNFKETILWVTGSVNYLWTCTAICFIILLVPKMSSHQFKFSDIGYFLVGILIGWSHEGISLPLALSFIIWFFVIRKDLIHKSCFSLIIGFIIGAFICSLSPGIIHKASLPEIGGESLNIPYRIKNGIQILLQLKIFYILIILLISIYVIKKHPLLGFKNFYKENIILINALIFSIPIIFVPDNTNSRVATGIELYSLLVILSLIKDFNGQFINIIKSSTIILSFLLLVPVTYYSYLNHLNWSNIEDQLKRHKSDTIVYEEFRPIKFAKNHILPNFANMSYNDKIKWSNMIKRDYNYDHLTFLPKRLYESLIMNKVPKKLIDQEKLSDFYVAVIDSLTTPKIPFIIYDHESKEDNHYIKGEIKKIKVSENQYTYIALGEKCYVLIYNNDYYKFKPLSIILE